MNEPVDLGSVPLYRGDAWRMPITDYAADGTTPTNLTGYGSAWAAQMRQTPDSPTAVTITVDATAAATGQLVLTLAAATTAELTASLYVFDVQATGGAVSPITVYRGTVVVTRDVTRP